MVLAEGVLFRPRGLAGGGEGEEGREEDEGAFVVRRVETIFLFLWLVCDENVNKSLSKHFSVIFCWFPSDDDDINDDDINDDDDDELFYSHYWYYTLQLRATTTATTRTTTRKYYY